MRVLAIDPGSKTSGYAILEDKDFPLLLALGQVELGKRPYHLRMPYLVEVIDELNKIWSPEAIVCERYFHRPGLTSRAYLAVIIQSISEYCKDNKIPYYQYLPNQWKRTVRGNGQACKKEVERVVLVQLEHDKQDSNLLPFVKSHVADAVGLALHQLNMSRIERMG